MLKDLKPKYYIYYHYIICWSTIEICQENQHSKSIKKKYHLGNPHDTHAAGFLFYLNSNILYVILYLYDKVEK